MDSCGVPDPGVLVDLDFLFGELTQLVGRVAKCPVQHAATDVLPRLVAPVGQQHHLLRHSQDLDDVLIAGPCHVSLQSEQFHRHVRKERTDQPVQAGEANNALMTIKIAGGAPWSGFGETLIGFVTDLGCGDVDPSDRIGRK